MVAGARTPGFVEPLFRRGQAEMALVIDPDFAANLDRGLPARLLLVTDASDPNTGTTMQAYARAVINGYQTELSGAGEAIIIEPRVRMRFNPTLESVNLFV